MNTDIRFLQQLEDDLTEAAAREAALLGRRSAIRLRSTERSRRLPRRERHWGAIAAGARCVPGPGGEHRVPEPEHDAGCLDGERGRRNEARRGRRRRATAPAAQPSAAPASAANG